MVIQPLCLLFKVHHLDLKSRLPWLKNKQKNQKEEAVEDEQGVGVTGEDNDEQRETEVVAEEGTSEAQETEGDNFASGISEHSLHSQLLIHQTTPTDHTPQGSLGKLSFQLQSDGMELRPPTLPPKDYPSQSADLPPRDYPVSSAQPKTHEQTGDLISDDDYYAQMMNDFNT